MWYLHHSDFEKFVSVTRWSERQVIRLLPNHMSSYHLNKLLLVKKCALFFITMELRVSRMCNGTVNLTTLPKTLANKCSGLGNHGTIN